MAKQFGVIYSDSADKATRFIANCNQKKNLAFVQDVTVLWWDLNQNKVES
jgi:acetyl-CoA carboxylase carboxyltransferase component